MFEEVARFNTSYERSSVLFFFFFFFFFFCNWYLFRWNNSAGSLQSSSY